MLRLKFSRTGKTKQPYFRLIVVEKARDPWGEALEILGNYDPRTKACNFNKERILYWIGHGAQPTDTIHNMLITQEIIKGKKVKVSKLSKAYKARIAKEEEAKKPKEEKKPEVKTEEKK